MINIEQRERESSLSVQPVELFVINTCKNCCKKSHSLIITDLTINDYKVLFFEIYSFLNVLGNRTYVN